MDLREHVAARLASLAPQAPICVGLSGGLDSAALVDLLAALRAGRALSAVHVHHGLSASADAWARFCGDFCAERGIALDVVRVHVDRASGLGLEAAARRARHAVFAARVEPIVALAHHRDDQAETLLLQVLRGTGIKGLAAMPEQRALDGGGVTLWRPLLEVARSDLLAYAKSRGLRWIEDESNASLDLDRNYLRHEIAPRLDARFPGWRGAAARLADHARVAEAMLAELAERDGALAPTLAIDPSLDAARRANVLRRWLAARGLAMPTTARLAQIASQLYDARDDARVRIAHEGAWLVRHRGTIHIERGECAPPAWRVPWHGEPEVALGKGRGRVRFASIDGSGLSLVRAGAADWHFAARRGGERLRLDPRGPTRTLKNLLREAAIPEWRRGALPLLFAGDRLAWVPGLGVAAELACGPGETGLEPVWTPADASAA